MFSEENMSDPKPEPVVLSNPKHAALAIAIDGRLRGVNQLALRHLIDDRPFGRVVLLP